MGRIPLETSWVTPNADLLIIWLFLSTLYAMPPAPIAAPPPIRAVFLPNLDLFLTVAVPASVPVAAAGALAAAVVGVAVLGVLVMLARNVLPALAVPDPTALVALAVPDPTALAALAVPEPTLDPTARTLVPTALLPDPTACRTFCPLG